MRDRHEGKGSWRPGFQALAALWLLAGVGLAWGGQSASSVADLFLAAIRSTEPLQRASLLEGVRWNAPGFEYPVFDEATTVAESFVDTDVAGVRGYERLVQLRVALRPGVYVLKSYRLLAFADRRWGRWKVWAFYGSHDVEAALAHWRERLHEATEADQAPSLECAYYLSISGRLQEALELYERAAEAIRADPAAGPMLAEVEATIQDLRRIVSLW